MNKQLITSTFIVLLFLSSFAQTQPNILLIISDDLGVDVSNGYHQGALMPNTPVLDSLRNSGITFGHVWSAPKCTPTRAAMMSGKFGIKTGVQNAPGTLDTTHTSIFKALATQTGNQYADAAIGKWHLKSSADPMHPTDHGVDHYTGALGFGVADYYSWQKTKFGTTATDTNYVTSDFTNEAIDWINAQTQPWFTWLAHVSPHSPIHVPPAHMFSLSPIGTNFRKYIAMIESMDYEIGRLLDSIPDSVKANTLIIYVGDNGTPGNFIQDYPANHAKGTLYQGGVRVPMIVSGAGVTRQGEREDALIQVADIYATILEIAGANLPGGVYNSLSFAHLLDNSGGSTRDYNYTDIVSPTVDGWTVRGPQYKLIQYANSSWEFFDLINDSLETTDLSASLTSAQQLIKDDLHAEGLQIRTAWSCRDHIQNGDELGIDCGGSHCDTCVVTGVEDLFASETFKIYPNPTKDFLHIERDKVNAQAEVIVRITGLDGKLYLSKVFDRYSTKLSLDLSGFTPQLMVLSFHDASGSNISSTQSVLISVGEH